MKDERIIDLTSEYFGPIDSVPFPQRRFGATRIVARNEFSKETRVMYGEPFKLGAYSAMTTKQRDPSDPAILAASVRDVAIEARRILNDSARNPFEVGALAKRINDLQSQVPSRSTSELSRWLQSLSREVDFDPQKDQKVTV